VLGRRPPSSFSWIFWMKEEEEAGEEVGHHQGVVEVGEVEDR
jgi:hypothetical protein